MAKIDIPSVASKLYELLEPLEPPMRKPAVKATLTMLGDDDVDLESENPKGKRTEETDGGADGSGISRASMARILAGRRVT